MASVFLRSWPGVKTRRKKYGNKRINTKDGWFDSKGEMRRWEFLKRAEEAGEITELERQIEFSFDMGDRHICSYIADYTYINKDKLFVVEDFKGVITDVFKLKAKMVKIWYGLDVNVVKKADAPIFRVDNPKRK